MLNDPKAGAINLLKHCLNIQSTDSVLLVLEPDDVFYAHEVVATIRECLNEFNANVTVEKPKLISNPADFPEYLALAMNSHDHTLFLSRIGDYVRFVQLPGNGSRVTNYALNLEALGSAYATVNYRLMHKLQLRLEDELMNASQWQIQCPLGTDLSGHFCWPSLAGGQDDDLTVSLFPVATFKPVPCIDANGQVALSRWLMPGGAAKLDNADMTINGVVRAHVIDGYLGTFSGVDTEVRKLNNHYDYISKTLGINRNRIHSWHVGINPQTHFDHSADEFLDLWSAISFGSPKYLHLHTCGDEPPGEIAWSVFNPTITIDDTVFWENGEFVWLQRADNKALIATFNGAHHLLEPSLSIGVN